jgi:DNA-binding transcriptional ArsR family regulator
MTLDSSIATLGDPIRKEILRRLADAPLRAGDLASGFAVSRPAISKHTRLLARAGFIQARKSGRERIYELAPSGGHLMRETIGALKELERFWEVALDAFKRHAEKKMIIHKSIRVERPQPITSRIFAARSANGGRKVLHSTVSRSLRW